ncbi:MAG TPA: class I SAM-dependent methyltransferase [Solirubrobacterales bacterium]|nr:class I SAM-dependent methyltransferase [Solirubrobacterales bacterium]
MVDAARQREAVESIEALPGWLLEADALKLYELAHLATGPILEIGTYRGKSAILMATALRDAGRPGPVVSLDVDVAGLGDAAAEAAARGLADRLVLVRGTAQALFRAQPGLAPSLVFLDGDHSQRGVARDLRALRPRVPGGGLILFHDYRDERNADPAEPDYAVPQAIESSWVARDCELEGVFGCCGLFRRRTGPQRTGGIEVARGGEIVDLGREPLGSWFDRRVLGALARRLS